MIVQYLPYDRFRLDPELLPQDFDPEFGVGPPDGAALEQDLFGDLIGCEDIKKQLTRIRSTFLHAERLGRDPLQVDGKREGRVDNIRKDFACRFLSGEVHGKVRDGTGQVVTSSYT